MMVFITGDTHGNIDIKKLNTKNFKEGNSLSKNDYLIITGDCGLVWNGSKEDLYWQNWIKEKPWTTIYIDGNHENFELLNSYPIVEFLGAKMHKINDSLYHICRGEIFTIEGRTFFGFGGAESIDKYLRKEGKDWWKEEIPSKEEMEYGVSNIENNKKIDYIITHTCPSHIFPFVMNRGKTNGEVERYLNFLDYLISETNDDFIWYFGHFHKDIKNIKGKYNCVYRDIIKLF